MQGKHSLKPSEPPLHNSPTPIPQASPFISPTHASRKSLLLSSPRVNQPRSKGPSRFKLLIKPALAGAPNPSSSETKFRISAKFPMSKPQKAPEPLLCLQQPASPAYAKAGTTPATPLPQWYYPLFANQQSEPHVKEGRQCELG